MILSVEGLSVSYGGIGALHDVTLSISGGEIVTVIGPNGAGKSTLLNAVMGVHPGPSGDTGAVTFAGRPMRHLSIEDRVRLGMCLVPEKRELFGSMTVEDNLRLGAFRFRRQGPASLDEVYALFPRLRERRTQHAGTLSGGERQMLAMGRALMARPDLLMLDEPSLGLAPLIVREVFRIIAGLAGRGCAVLLVEQNARAALQVADHGYVLETGRVALEGPSAGLAGNARVIETYLGAGPG